LTEGKNQHSYADYANGNGKKVNLSFQMLASVTRFNRAFAVSKGKYQSSTAFGSRGVASSYDFSGFQSGASVVSVMDISTNDSAGRWGSPRREFSLSRNNGERELGNKVFRFQPTNMNSLERVMNFDSVARVNNFGLNHNYPNDCANSNGIGCCDESSMDVADREVRNSSENADKSDYCEVDPITAGPVNVRVSHVGQTIAGRNKVSPFSATKEGN